MLVSYFGFNKDTFTFITVFLAILAVVIYLFLSKSLFEPLFKSDEQIQGLIKKTLHELNTPVSTIKINQQMLKKNETDEKNLKRLERIEQACTNLLNLYSQMEYSLKKEVDNITTEEFDLAEIVDKSISNFDDIKKNITLINEVNTHLNIQTDKNGFETVINNLIANGIKYNKPDGYVKLYLTNHTLNIEDSGIGIDTKDLFKVFDKYFQENTLNQGVGLGLNIVKEFCDEHKIKINIQSKPDIGTTISLDLTNII